MEQDLNRIFIDLTNRANNADIDAMNILHDYYINEKYTLLKYNEELIEFYKCGAEEKKPYSLFHLGLMYCYGSGVEKNLETTVELFKASMIADCSQAYVYMGPFVKNHGVKYEMTCEQLVDKGMDMGNSNAYIHKAIYISKINHEESIKLLRKAIELDNTYAIYQLAEIYHNSKNYEQSIKYYNLAIDKNINCACFDLATIYMTGEGVPVDKTKALELFTKAHELGNEMAIISIGKINQDFGNIKKAKECYQFAIDRDGDGIAYYNMGLLYKEEDNHKQAIKSFIEGTKANYIPSKQILIYEYGVMKSEMTDEEIDELLDLHKKIKNLDSLDGFML